MVPLHWVVNGSRELWNGLEAYRMLKKILEGSRSSKKILGCFVLKIFLVPLLHSSLLYLFNG